MIALPAFHQFAHIEMGIFYATQLVFELLAVLQFASCENAPQDIIQKAASIATIPLMFCLLDLELAAVYAPRQRVANVGKKRMFEYERARANNAVL